MGRDRQPGRQTGHALIICWDEGVLSDECHLNLNICFRHIASVPQLCQGFSCKSGLQECKLAFVKDNVGRTFLYKDKEQKRDRQSKKREREQD